MRCIAVDDEPRALEIIDNFISKIDFLDLVGKFRNPVDAIDFLLQNKIDLIFLDINMPDITGTELVKILNQKPMIIFTTAYSEYAIESYELDAIDYLLKPFEFDRFLKAVIKAKEASKLSSGVENNHIVYLNTIDNKIQLKSGSETFQIKIDDIKYIEGLGNYVNVYLTKKKIATYISLKDFLEKLPKDGFTRIHKSYIISINHIKSFENYQVKLDDKTIPIGKNYRKDFIELMKKRTR
ncbi:MAG: LytTR family DNA-binding domain-containing protein [Bacteroidales bacterium]|jgi:two-component system LytT family response regulator|nr:LytTR family DNA-binding domain-containing protein [Bacteroidales bacterium]